MKYRISRKNNFSNEKKTTEDGITSYEQNTKILKMVNNIFTVFVPEQIIFGKSKLVNFVQW